MHDVAAEALDVNVPAEQSIHADALDTGIYWPAAQFMQAAAADAPVVAR